MIVAATPSFHSSLRYVPPTSCPHPASPATLLTSEMQFLQLRCKDAFNVFNNIQPLFCKTGGWGYQSASKIHCAQKDEKII
jgi:hypothetical protein